MLFREQGKIINLNNCGMLPKLLALSQDTVQENTTEKTSMNCRKEKKKVNKKQQHNVASHCELV